MIINLKNLNEFLVDANANGYAGGGKEISPPQRPGFSEIEYKKGDWMMHDSYAGHFFAPGQEVVYYKGKPVWAMAYAGGMEFKYHANEKVTRQAVVFLKKALVAMDPTKPFRGPKLFQEGGMKYVSKTEGDTKDFFGNEKIYNDDELVFEQNFIGGIIVG